MTPADWRKLREILGVSNAELCRRIGIHENSGSKYQRDGNEIPLTVALACAAVVRDLKPWPE